MAATLIIGHPDITSFPQTFVASPIIKGDTTAVVQNATDFSQQDLVLIGQYGNPLAALYPISTPLPSSLSIPIGSSQFGYPLDTPVTKIPFNTVKIYRSTTGTGGSYSLLVSVAIQVDQIATTYTDFSAVSPYSYKYTYYNSTLNVESDFSSEMPYGGFPFYSLNSIQRRTLTLYVDQTGEFINLQSIADWTNELLSKFNRAVTDSESTPFATFATFTPGNNESVDLSQYNVESIFLLEYSSDNGMTWNGTINPMDSRIKANNPIGEYSYKMEGDKLFIYTSNVSGGSQSVTFPVNYMVRMWYFTQQTPLSLESDTLPALYRSFTEIFVDYCMMRANEQSRRFAESAVYYAKRVMGSSGDGTVSGSFKGAVDTIRGRINQGNKSMALTWASSFYEY